jgi:hypothetical protein
MIVWKWEGKKKTKNKRYGRGTENGEKNALRHQMKRGKEQKLPHTETEAIYGAFAMEPSKDGGEFDRKVGRYGWCQGLGRSEDVQR